MIFSLNSSVKRGVGGKSQVRYRNGDSVIISLYSSLVRSTFAASSASGGGSFLQRIWFSVTRKEAVWHLILIKGTNCLSCYLNILIVIPCVDPHMTQEWFVDYWTILFLCAIECHVQWIKEPWHEVYRITWNYTGIV